MTVPQKGENKRSCYYHASPRPLPPVLTPRGHYERLDADGWPVMTYFDREAPLCQVSEVPEIACAKTVGGAVLGSITSILGGTTSSPIDLRSRKTFYIYETRDGKPEIDLADFDSPWLDFDITKEVRFRRPIHVRLVRTVKVTDEDLKDALAAYARTETDYGEYPPDKTKMARIRRAFDKRFSPASVTKTPASDTTR